MDMFGTICLLSLAISITIVGCHDQANKTVSRVKRVMGGQLATIDNYPYLVGLTISHDMGRAICGGAILTEEWIVTAAHCFVNYVGPAYVHAGSNFLSLDQNTSLSGQIHMASRPIIHPLYMAMNRANDIALVKVDPPFVWDENHKPIPLMQVNDIIQEGEIGIIAGYGQAGPSPAFLNFGLELHGTILPIFNNEKCWRIYEETFDYSSNPKIFCAGYAGLDARNSLCPGDCGSPLIVRGQLAGITTRTDKCRNLQRTPARFLRIPAYQAWIEMHVGRRL